VLAVLPGAAGQKFLSEDLEKIMVLRQASPSAIIEVDGGMNPETARLVKTAGADTIVSASYIFGSGDPKKAYEELRKI
jgi:ribulose-phosphate 3-epimerase